jgi:uncharacterized protein (DUF1684 family)
MCAGFMEFMALGQLVFPLDGEERRLTALGKKGSDTFSVWFKDRTNGSTTYGGYRTIRPQAVKDGEWTVLDTTRRAHIPCSRRVHCCRRRIACPTPSKRASRNCRPCPSKNIEK